MKKKYMAEDIKNIYIYAWIALEDHGVTLQRAVVTAVPIPVPLVDVDSGKVLRPPILRQLQQHAAQNKTPLRLVRFQAVEVILEIEP